MENNTLFMKNIIKDFPGVKALAGVDFSLNHGEVHALLGINGAGKSTLIKILSGILQKDSGEIHLNGKKIEIRNPHEAKMHGVATVYQDPQMIPSFTGYENIFLGSETANNSIFAPINRRNLRKRAQFLLERFPIEVDLNKPVGELATIDKESIAILRALSQDNMSILILDEPTSILTHSEKNILFDQIRVMKSRGISIIYITHRLDEVFQIADRFTILRDGKAVGTYSVDEGVDNNKIAELMLGEKLNNIFPERNGKPGTEVLRVEGLSFEDKFQNVSFTACKGEVIGIFGLVGSGFDELCKVLFGVLSPRAGRIKVKGKEVQHRSVSDAVRNGIFLIPGDRRIEGQILNESIAFNTTLANLDHVAGIGGLIRIQQENNDTISMVDKLKIKTPGIKEGVSLLSGGNQQKVVIGKGLYTDAELYVFEEPTVGVDVGAKSGIYHLIRDLSKQKAVIVVSSDCEEVYGLCDRIIVLYKGQVVLNQSVNNTRLDEILLIGLTGGINGNNL
jgi:ribose transport system ATP-binding protein